MVNLDREDKRIRRLFMNSGSRGNEKRRIIYTYLISYIARYGMPPTRREIQRVIGVQSVSTVTYHLNILEDLGIIMFRAGIDGSRISRNIVVVDADLLVRHE